MKKYNQSIWCFRPPRVVPIKRQSVVAALYIWFLWTIVMYNCVGIIIRAFKYFFSSPALLFSQVMFSSNVLVSCVGGHMNFYFYMNGVYFLLLFVSFCYMDLVFYFDNCFFYNLHYFNSIFSSFQCFSGLFHNFMLTL